MAADDYTSRDALLDAGLGRALVQVERSVERGFVTGYVAGVGPDWFLLCVVSDEMLFNGFQAFRLVDVVKVWHPAPHSAFIERALGLRGLARPDDPGLDLETLNGLLTSASQHSPLVTIHREVVDPESCHIGRVIGVSERVVRLKAMTPDATWSERIEEYLLTEVTRVDVGGLYEDALNAVAQET
jgi:hypothetical protein